jgi:hypothetical protein
LLVFAEWQSAKVAPTLIVFARWKERLEQKQREDAALRKKAQGSTQAGTSSQNPKTTKRSSWKTLNCIQGPVQVNTEPISSE